MTDRMAGRIVFEDKKLECVDCGETFTWLAGEQRYYCSKKFSQPTHCPLCRERRKKTLLTPDNGGEQ